MNNLDIVILAAGLGKRMNSNIPKVLHKIANKPMLQYVIETSLKLCPRSINIIYGFGADLVMNEIDKIFPDNNFNWCYQHEQLGTAHALQCALENLGMSGSSLILYGDVPLVDIDILQLMVDNCGSNLVLLTSYCDNPSGYGRIIRDNKNKICKIVEDKDLAPEQKLIKEINTGIYILPNYYIHEFIGKITNNNNQVEYYLTDFVGMAYDFIDITDITSNNDWKLLGVNDKSQLEFVQRLYQQEMINKLLKDGLTIIDRNKLELRGNLQFGKDCVIDVNCILEGNVALGDNVTIEANCIIRNVKIGSNVTIKAFSYIEEALISNECVLGPFVRIRSQVDIKDNSKIGNFVEIKKSHIGKNTKINHLSYIGDAQIGDMVNIGAGVVTCNYDGENKNKTIIENNAFIGSGSMLVAPVTIGDNGLIGAGSVITTNTPSNELTLSRVKQQTIVGWKKRHK